MKQLDPKAVWLFFLQAIPGWLALLFIITMSAIILSFGDAEGGDSAVSTATLWWILTIPVLLFTFIWAKLTYRFYRYELTDAGFRKELGVITKKYVTIPYDRIQNVDIYRGILARVLGLSDLNIQTAGASGQTSRSEGRLPALSHEVAEQLRDELIQRATKAKKNQGV